MFCDKTTKCGIFRAKQHLVGNFKNTTACKKCPLEVKEELLSYMNEKKITKNESYGNLPEDDVEYLRDEEEDYSLSINQSGKKVSDRRGKEVVSTKKAKKGPMDLYMFQGSQKQQGQAGGSKFRQTNISDACDKEIRGRTI
ncbi:unnamed protein product, partial [Musa textilis]